MKESKEKQLKEAHDDLRRIQESLTRATNPRLRKQIKDDIKFLKDWIADLRAGRQEG